MHPYLTDIEREGGKKDERTVMDEGTWRREGGAGPMVLTTISTFFFFFFSNSSSPLTLLLLFEMGISSSSSVISPIPYQAPASPPPILSWVSVNRRQIHRHRRRGCSRIQTESFRRGLLFCAFLSDSHKSRVQTEAMDRASLVWAFGY